MPPPLDLVQDSKLITDFRDGYTIHTFTEPSGHRKEYWKSERRLGRGGSGQVQLERCAAGEKKDLKRAVKIISRRSNPTRTGWVDLERELEAIAKFSQSRVSEYQRSSQEYMLSYRHDGSTTTGLCSHSDGMQMWPRSSSPWSTVIMAISSTISLTEDHCRRQKSRT